MTTIYSFRDIMEAKARGDMEAVNEASLGRIYQHIQKQKDTPWAIMTSYRRLNSAKENATSFVQLRKKVESLGYGFTSLKGVGMEVPDKYPEGTSWKSIPQDELIRTVEPSIFIIGIPKAQAVRLMKNYDQDAILYAGPETGGKVVMVDKSGTDTPLGEFHPQNISQFYSRIKGKPFFFEAKAGTMGEYLLEFYHGRTSK